MRQKRLLLFAVVALVGSLAVAENPKQGRNRILVRGQGQDIYFYPSPVTGGHGKLLFVPGDGGWRGFAVEMAEQLQAAGYDVYGLDTRRYLQSFTGNGGLKTSDIGGDFRQIVNWIRQGNSKPILFVGWSEGAGLALVAASDRQNKELFLGVVAIGMTEDNILAWRWSDTWAEMEKNLPKEPTFPSSEFVGLVAPLPLFLISSSHDEYVTVEATRSLFARAREPKKLVIIEAKDHKYGGNTDEFFWTLKQSLTWIVQPRP